MKRYKLIEVVHGDVTSEPADVETWGSRNHVTRINELAADGWTIMSIVPDYGTHGEPLVYLEKETCIGNDKKYYAAEVRPGVWAVYNSEVLEKYCNSEEEAIVLAEELNDNYEKGNEQ